MRRRVTFLLLIVVWILPAVTAAEEDEWPEGLFIEPSFLISTFTTNKGELTVDENTAAEIQHLDVHTGNWNWIFMPELGCGWNWGSWFAALRLAYPVQLARLDLPYGHTAEGVIHSLEIGPMVYYRLANFRWTTVEAQFGLAWRPFASAWLQYDYPEAMETDDGHTFNGMIGWSGFAMMAGAGGDLMRGEHVLLGWIWRFYWGHFALEREEGHGMAIDYADRPGEMVDYHLDEQLDLNVYSAVLGLRLRLYPYAISGGNRP